MTHLAVSDPNGPALPLCGEADARRARAGRRGDRSLSRLERRLDGVARRQRPHVQRRCTERSGLAARQAWIDLVLDPGKPPAINGINGISQKGAQAGNASHYYSLTRMPTRGTITVDGERFEVSGRQLDGSRVRHQLSRAGPARLGLAVDPARRRPRPDAVSAAPERRQPRSAIERHAGRRRRPHHSPRRRRVFAHAGTPRRSAPPTARSTRSSGRSRSRRRSSTCRSRRRSTTRSSTSAAAPAWRTGKARST